MYSENTIMAHLNWRDAWALNQVAGAMFDAEASAREREVLEHEGRLDMLGAYVGKASLDTAWAADGKTRGVWLDGARNAMRSIRGE